MSKLVELQLTHDHADLLVHALREMANVTVDRLANSDEYTGGYSQPGQLRWLATYVEHKLRDAR